MAVYKNYADEESNKIKKRELHIKSFKFSPTICWTLKINDLVIVIAFYP